ncbi:hypothetical protein [Streptomyces mirabilis]|uniref:hypothetical protein n=1 Tax=Streptomyces mirabilis TaxID=68239 RepID=UPI00167EB85B|nr:hypothetical protein [Streptomyces mirabilis]
MPEADGDAGFAGEAEGADGEVAPGRHGAGREAGSQLGDVLGERHISDGVQGLASTFQ